MSDELGFSSKVDLWMLVLVLAVVAACLFAIAALWESLPDRGWLFSAAVLVPLAAGVLAPLWMLVTLRYFLSSDSLRVRCGPFRWQIAIAGIESVTPMQSLASGPALSTDRLRIAYAGGRTLMISPEPRAEFLRQLEHRRGQPASRAA